MQCDLSTDALSSICIVEVRSDNIYNFECRNGHHNVAVVQEEKFQILFEIGLNAIVDGYYREAISSATSALERFYEYYVRVVARNRSIANAEFERAWKPLNNRSERQLGAFVALHLLQTGAAPTLLAENPWVNIRNRVIHQGLIPSTEEAIGYANAVFKLISPTLLNMEETLHAEMWAVRHDRVLDLHNRVQPTEYMTAGVPTLIKMFSHGQPQPTTVNAHLENIRLFYAFRQQLERT